MLDQYCPTLRVYLTLEVLASDLHQLVDFDVILTKLKPRISPHLDWRFYSGSNMESTTLTDLPLELLDHITAHLPTARSVANLGRTDKKLQAFAEKEEGAWKSFNASRFPSLHPAQAASHRDVARTLTTLSKAWDRRAFVARYIEPHGDIRAFPGNQRIERWKRPRGQTIGFTPQLDCFEEVGSSWRNRKETLAFSAGAEICVREKQTRQPGVEDTRWMVYRPADAAEGKDDVTSVHLIRPGENTESNEDSPRLITGTANGNLQLISLPTEDGADVLHAQFTTEGQPVRSSSILQRSGQETLLAANLGDDCVALYQLDAADTRIAPTNTINIPRPSGSHKDYRTWSTSFLSTDNLSIGLGPSDEPIHIYALTPSGIDKVPLRKYSLLNDAETRDDEVRPGGIAKKIQSSVYPIVPLPPYSSSAAGNEGQIFLSGSQDGVIRLHDLRSNTDVEQTYIDPTDDSGIYSLLPHGQETLVAGTSRHSLLKVFDLRLGAKAYSYLDNDSNASTNASHSQNPSKDWNLFLKPHSATYPGRGGGNNWARRSAESSIYSLASPSPCSPYVYAGVENAVLELAFTSILDPHPDPTFFSSRPNRRRSNETLQGFQSKEVLNLAMYDQTADMMKLKTQRSLWETFQVRNEAGRTWTDDKRWLEGLDERWKIVTA